MINLLPPKIKSDFQYARRNLQLRGWVTALTMVFVGMGAIVAFGLLDMQRSINSHQKQVADIQEVLREEKLAETEKQVEEISSSLRLATQVLSNTVLFSKLITQIGAAMPPGAVLSSLNVNKSSGGLDLNANAKDYTTASQVQVNLSSEDNKIFAKADLISISCTAAKSGQDKANPYPCTVSLRVLFNSKNQFLFINQDVKS